MKLSDTGYVLLLFLTDYAAAQVGGPCDTSVEVGACSIDFEVNDGDLLLLSTARACSVVDWSLDDQRQTTLVIEQQGARIEDAVAQMFTGSSRSPSRRAVRRRVNIHRCVEVRDLRVDERCYELQALLERLSRYDPRIPLPGGGDADVPGLRVGARSARPTLRDLTSETVSAMSAAGCRIPGRYSEGNSQAGPQASISNSETEAPPEAPPLQ